jgi:hypothetical protein
MKYTFTCGTGHEPMDLSIDAMNDDEALEKIMVLVKAHGAQFHANIVPALSDEQVMSLVKAMWKKE